MGLYWGRFYGWSGHNFYGFRGLTRRHRTFWSLSMPRLLIYSNCIVVMCVSGRYGRSVCAPLSSWNYSGNSRRYDSLRGPRRRKRQRKNPCLKFYVFYSPYYYSLMSCGY